MGDLRNKFHKQARDAAHAEFMARRYPPAPPAPPVRCLCGHTITQAPKMWQVSGTKSGQDGYYCPACLPKDPL